VGFDAEFGDGRDHGAVVVELDFVDRFEGFGGRFGQVAGGDLHGVEQQAGAFGVEHAVGDALGDDRNGGLDGGTVFERREVEGGELVAEFGLERAGFVGAEVVVTEVFRAQGFAAAAVAVGEDVAALEVLALGVRHGCVPPLDTSVVKSG